MEMNKSYPPNYGVGGTPATYSQPTYNPPPGGEFQQPPVYHQQGYQPQYPTPPNYNQSSLGTAITVQPTIVTARAVGPDPTHMICPSCNATIVTSVKHEPSSKTHCVALLLCCFVCWPCVCLPYCMDSCQNANHYCPNCSSYLGTYNQ